MSTGGDAEVVRRVLEGDRGAYRLLVERHEDMLFRRAAALLHGDTDLAADIVQDAFVRAYERLDSCGDPARFGGWVYRVVRNRCYDELRAARRRSVDIATVRTLASADDPEADLRRSGLKETIDAALDSLSPLLREAFVLKHVEGLDYDEIQHQTGVRKSALKMRVKRAREELERILAPLVADADVTPTATEPSDSMETAGPSRRGTP